MIESMLKKGKGSVRQLHQGQQNPNVSCARPAGGVRAGCFRSGSPALLPRPRSLGCLPSPLSAGFQWVPPVGGARGRKQSRRQEQTKKRAGGFVWARASRVPSRTRQEALPAAPGSIPVGFPEPRPHVANSSFTRGVLHP